MHFLSPYRRYQTPPRRGFVLVMTLVVLALAACAMSRFANRSLSTVRRGAQAERALQDRWSLVTCRLALLDRAEYLFAQAEAEQEALGFGWPYPASMSVSCDLNGKDYDITITDESTKLNVNWLHRERREQLQPLLAQAAVYGGIPIRLRPHETEPRQRAAVYSSWGQVVDLTRIDPQKDLAAELRPITEAFTCWGQGRVNVRRAGDEMIRTLLDDTLLPEEIEQFLTLRRGHQGTYEELLPVLDVPRRRLIGMKPLLATESNTFAMWLVEETASSYRTRLLVRDPTDRQTPETLLFEW